MTPTLYCHANPKAVSLQHHALPDRYIPQNTLNCSITSPPQAAGVDRQLLAGVIFAACSGFKEMRGKLMEWCMGEREVGGTSKYPKGVGKTDARKPLLCFALVHDFFNDNYTIKKKLNIHHNEISPPMYV